MAETNSDLDLVQGTAQLDCNDLTIAAISTGHIFSKTQRGNLELEIKNRVYRFVIIFAMPR